MARRARILLVSALVVGVGVWSCPMGSEAGAADLGESPIAGAIDIHAYGAPDYFERHLNDVELAQVAARYGMRGLVLMSHVTSTADRAALAVELVPGIEVFGGVVLNNTVGGLNPAAVEVMAHTQGGRGRIVWLPTIDAAHHRKVLDMPGEGIVVARDGAVTAEMEAILQIVAAEGLVLQTGHVSPDEALAVVARARALGIAQVVVTSPMSLPGFSLEQMRQAAELGAYLEIDYVNQLMGSGAHLEWMQTWPRVTVEETAAAIQAIGAEHFVLGSELGQVGNPTPPDGYLMFVEGLRNAGILQADLDLMMKANPAKLLGLDPVAAASANS